MFAASTALAEGAPVSRIGLSQAVAIALNLLLEIAICRGLVADDWLRDTFELVDISRQASRLPNVRLDKGEPFGNNEPNLVAPVGRVDLVLVRLDSGSSIFGHRVGQRITHHVNKFDFVEADRRRAFIL